MEKCRYGSDWHQIVETRATETPDAAIYRFLSYSRHERIPESVRTWAQLWQRSRAVAAWLQGHGCAGRPVLLAYAPGLDFIEALLGCLYAGAIGVPATPPRPNL